MSISFILMVLVGLSIGFVEMGSDIYAPCLPQICSVFQCTPAMASLTMALNLGAIAISGLFWGPLSDQYGRRRIILVGMAFFALGLGFCYMSQTLAQLITARLLQGIGGGVAAVVGMAMLKDVFSGNQLAKMISRLSFIICISPGVAPLIGGMIAQYSHWRGVFLASGVATLVLLVGLWRFLPETHKPVGGRVKMDLALSLGAYKMLLLSPRYLAYLAIHGLTLFWLWAELGNLPFFYIVQMGVSVSSFGYYTLAGVSIYLLGVVVNQYLVDLLKPFRLIGYAIYLQIFSAVLLTVLGRSSWITPFWVVVILAPSGIGLALSLGNAYALALEEAKNHAGAGSALILFMEVALGALGMYVLSLFLDHGIISLGVLMIIVLSIMLTLYLWLRSDRNRRRIPLKVT